MESIEYTAGVKGKVYPSFHSHTHNNDKQTNNLLWLDSTRADFDIGEEEKIKKFLFVGQQMKQLETVSKVNNTILEKRRLSIRVKMEININF